MVFSSRYRTDKKAWRTSLAADADDSSVVPVISRGTGRVTENRSFILAQCARKSSPDRQLWNCISGSTPERNIISVMNVRGVSPTRRLWWDIGGPIPGKSRMLVLNVPSVSLRCPAIPTTWTRTILKTDRSLARTVRDASLLTAVFKSTWRSTLRNKQAHSLGMVTLPVRLWESRWQVYLVIETFCWCDILFMCTMNRWAEGRCPWWDTVWQ